MFNATGRSAWQVGCQCVRAHDRCGGVRESPNALLGSARWGRAMTRINRLDSISQTRAAWRESRCRRHRQAGAHLLPVTALWEVLALSRPAVEFCLKASGLYRRGLANAARVKLREQSFSFASLPPAFHGFTILFISDLHIGGPIDTARSVAEELPDLAGMTPDLCVLGGDYTFRSVSDSKVAQDGLGTVLARLSPRLGTCAILGNHDSDTVVDWLEGLGVTVLANEALAIERNGATIVLCGTDDPHFFYTPAASELLASAPGEFSVALVHTVELADEAAAAGFDLYLAGHSHGGQICLPGGWPVITGVHRNRRLIRGRWTLGAMQGFTTTGAGVSGIPVRYNARAEIVLLTLKRADRK